ncbi:MAG: DNA adenine methylase [Spirochaetales bacterium]|nr:DNA adenine methylase [Spirochaetales bacterium]
MSTVLDISLDSMRRTQLRNDSRYIHIMKYMGSKRELLPEIERSIYSMIDVGDTILDIFSGTGSVGSYVKHDFNIISNDIQQYSKLICDATILSSSIKHLPNKGKIIEKIKDHAEVNRQHLFPILKNTISKSDDFSLIAKDHWTDKDRKQYIKFVEEFPSPVNGFSTKNYELNSLFQMYIDNSEDKRYFGILPYFQTTFLFSEIYFSLRQAIEIDSIKYAIDHVIEDEIIRSIYISALIHAYSYCSSGTGHFAMFRDLKDLKSVEDVFIYRKKNVWSFFEKKLNELYDFHSFYSNRKYETTSFDYMDLLQNDRTELKYNLIYADPPYSFVHYSRFYHATESLVKYDYDIPQFKGRYRSDRHQSPFCQKQNVEGAFELLFYSAKNKKSKVLLSYSDTGMIGIDHIIRIAKRNGFTIDVIEIKYNHSTLGREGHKSNKISEYLIQANI